jgi:hypothetical protein
LYGGKIEFEENSFPSFSPLFSLSSEWSAFCARPRTVHCTQLGKPPLHGKQGDRIGRIFGPWTIVFFGYFFENYGRSPNFVATFFHGRSDVLVLTKNGLGYIWGDFFTHHLVTLTASPPVSWWPSSAIPSATVETAQRSTRMENVCFKFASDEANSLTI